MAHKKAGGSSSNGRDSQSQRLGLKLANGQFAKAGSILVRQRGNKYHPGQNVGQGKDDTLFAKIAGIVKFSQKKLKKFDNSFKTSTIVEIVKQK